MPSQSWCVRFTGFTVRSGREIRQYFFVGSEDDANDIAARMGQLAEKYNSGFIRVGGIVIRPAEFAMMIFDVVPTPEEDDT